MSTRSLIGIEKPDGTCRAIYCHFDGYPTGNGLTLASCYMTTKDVENLLALGDISSLGNTPETCKAYCRDCGEEYNAPGFYNNRQEYFDAAYDRDTEYCYLFTFGTWLYADSTKWHDDHDWKRADVAQLDAEKIRVFDAYLQKLRDSGYFA